MKHLINWLEIPVADMQRAKTFYSKVFGVSEFHEMEMDGAMYAIFPTQDRFNAGALVQSPFHKPSVDGVTVYFDGGKDMDPILGRIESAGGEVIMPKTFTGKEAGYVAMFGDTEGNKIGLQHP